MWNEPNYSGSWNGTIQQFYQTYLSAFGIIRSMLGPTAPVAGPSFYYYNHQGITDFLEFCLANGCEVNSLTWHELDDTSSIASMVADVQDARSSFLQNPRYAPLKIQRIDVNEIVGPVFSGQPAGTLAYYGALEQSGADAAAHACWSDSAGGDQCDNGTLDGLLTASTFQPRAVWWVHKSYADGVSQRVQATTSDANVVALASSSVSGASTPQILIGNVNSNNSGTASPVNVSLVLNSLNVLYSAGPLNTINLNVELIPNTGEAALPQPISVTTMTAVVSGNSATAAFPPLQPGEVFRVTLSPVVAAVLVSSLQCQASSLASNASTTCTVTLNQAAPSGGSVVTIGGGIASVLTVPGAVTVPAGATTASFTASTASLLVNQTATVSASLNGASQSFNISLVAPVLVSSLQCQASSLASNASTTCTVTLNQAAPSGGSVVTIGGGIAGVLTVPGTVTVPAGATTASFTASTALLLVNQTATVSASLNGASQAFNISLVSQPGPTINSGGIVPVNGTSSTIAPGEWVSIFGMNLATATKTWAGDFPTSLGGTSVMIDGKPATLSYVSPTQINLQAPDDMVRGLVPVSVTTPNGTAVSTVTLAQFAPSFLLLDTRHVAGIIPRSDKSGAYGGGSYDILGPTGTSLGYPTVAAKPGDVLELFATGLGFTNPPVPAGQPFSGAAPTVFPVTVFINGLSVTPMFSGLSSAGLYQINLIVPAGVPSGDVPLALTVAGTMSGSGVVMSIR
ncbi:MAG TPA: IPT/TIG domain-containing protein [Bryobacteraceae bacterium]|nr:IPT/TIG domain-containing protein [Bryobacteraceae bacterium]